MGSKGGVGRAEEMGGMEGREEQSLRTRRAERSRQKRELPKRESVMLSMITCRILRDTMENQMKNSLRSVSGHTWAQLMHQYSF